VTSADAAALYTAIDIRLSRAVVELIELRTIVARGVTEARLHALDHATRVLMEGDIGRILAVLGLARREGAFPPAPDVVAVTPSVTLPPIDTTGETR